MPQPAHKGEYPNDWHAVATLVKDDARWCCVRCRHVHDPKVGRTLTVHHFDGNKANLARWNLMALCQACHLSVQARVDPEIPLLFPPTAWAIPYLVGLYAAGQSVAPPGFDAAEWRKRYEHEVGAWPAWMEA